MGKTLIGDIVVQTPKGGALIQGRKDDRKYFSFDLSATPLAGPSYQQTITGLTVRGFTIKRLVWGVYVTDVANAPKQVRFLIGKIATTGADGFTSFEPLTNTVLGTGFSRQALVRFMNQENGYISEDVNIQILPNQTFEITLLVYTVAALVGTDVIEGTFYLEYE